MQEQTIAGAAAATTEQVIKQLIAAWTTQNKIVTDFFNKYEGVFEREVAPGRNRAMYILGHLVAISDGMIPLMGLGDRLYPSYEPLFVSSPDKSSSEYPSLPILKQHWETVNNALTGYFNAMRPEDWLGRHTKVSPEDFAVNPLRNKLSILISRTNHQSYHSGQLALLK